MSATRLIFTSFESIISDVIVSPFKKEPCKVVYTHKWAREGWPKDHLYLEELYPLRYAKFGKTHILIPNKSEDYLNRLLIIY